MPKPNRTSNEPTDGNDVLSGSRSNDTIDALAGDDTVLGKSGNDALHGGAGNDDLYGDRGNDELHGDQGNDDLYGGAGSDTLNGNTGNDDLYGEAGNDTLNGGEGNDDLYGGVGSDTLNGGDGSDWAFGGEGDDTFVFDSEDGLDYIYDFRAADADKIDLRSTTLDWATLDTNESGVLDDGDANVRVDNGTTVIDLGAANGDASDLNTITVVDVTGLTMSDFLF